MTNAQPSAFAALLRRHRMAAHLTQAELAERAGLSPEAVSALERGVNRSPRRETVALLADALGVPGREREQLEAAARQRPTLAGVPMPFASPSQASALPPLVGRAGEVRLIEGLLDGTQPPVLLFAGEPGVGKTRLLHAAAEAAVASGWMVLFGGCQRASDHDPYAPLLGLIERHVAQRPDAGLRADVQGCGWLVRLLPELAERGLAQPPEWALAPDQERRLMFAAVARFLANVAGPAGTLLVLDDLHWAGADACDLLAVLVGGASATPVRVVGAYRDSELAPDGPAAHLIGELARAGRLHQAAPHRLTVDESDELLRALLDEAGASGESGEAGVRAQRHLVQRSGGIPFYLVSWAQAVRSGTGDAQTDDALPWDVLQSVRQRVAAQPEAAREALHVLAVAGGTAAFGLLRAVLAQGGRSEDDLVAGLESAQQARLVDESGGDRYQFAHDLIGDVVARDLSAARRTTLHRRIAESLEGQPGEQSAEALALHYLRGGEPVKAVAYLERAGDRAVAMQALAAAQTAYAELVERLDALGRPPEAARAREKWGTVLGTLGRYEQALTAFERAFAAHRGAGDAEAQARNLVQIGQVHADRGTARQGIERLAAMLAPGAARGISPRTLAALHDVHAQLLHLTGQYREQLEEAERAVALARDAHDEPLLCQIGMRRGNALRMLGQMREASNVLEDVIATAEALGDPRILSSALDNVSVVYLLQGEFARAARYVERALALSEQLGDPLVHELLILRRGMNAYVVGDWSRAREDFTRARAMTRQLDISWVSAYTALGLGQLLLAQGDGAAASALLEESVALAEQAGDLQALRWAQTALAERDLLAGNAQAAHARLEPLLDRPGQQEGLVTYLLPYLAEADGVLGDDERAEQQVRECLARATDEHIHLALVDALRIRALLALRHGRLDEAEQALRSGLTVSRAMPYPYAEAKLIYTEALLARERGEPERARALLLDARDALHTLGEGLYLPHVERALAQPR